MGLFTRKPASEAIKPKSTLNLKAMVGRLKSRGNFDWDSQLIIGIDFGTTYSGAAWATVSDIENDNINIIEVWPGTGRQEGKAPTTLYYDRGTVRWGYDVPRDASVFQWFKLLLLKKEDLGEEVEGQEFLARAQKMLEESGKSATEIVSDYLRSLWQHILGVIVKTRGKVIDAMKFHVVITVPAIWKNYAREAMREAANRAGILAPRRAGTTSLSFAPEPEAAALASLCEQQGIKENDIYVVCDAGGGTVDLITYRVGSIDPVIELCESVPGQGGLCGGVFIDQEFERKCRDRLGEHWDSLSPTAKVEIMKDEWEYAIKPEFKHTKVSKEYIVKIPAEAFKGSRAGLMNDNSKKPIIKDGRIHFSSSDIDKTFRGSFSGIKKLLDMQINQAKSRNLDVTGIILVGGLGSSPFLYETLVERYKKIQVLQADGIKPRTAICRGAIYKGLIDRPEVWFQDGGDKIVKSLETTIPITVRSTIARQNLGVRFETDYDKDVHKEEEKIWNENEGKWVVSGLMRWYLLKGQEVSMKKPVRHNFNRVFQSPEDFGEYSREEIFQCDEDDAPQRTDSTVEKFDSVSVTLETDYNSLQNYVAPNGRRFKRMPFEIEMVPSGASVEFAVYYQGKKIGSRGRAI